MVATRPQDTNREKPTTTAANSSPTVRRPYCGVVLDPPPKATKKCPACGQKMHLKRVAGTDERRLMTEADVEQNESEWARYHERADLVRRAMPR